eukprot:Awhi_evm1s6317
MAEMVGMFFFLFVSLAAVNSTFLQNNAYINNVLIPVNGEAPDTWATLRVDGVLSIAFGFGMSILCLAYSLGHISGGHFNPAVTLACVCFGGMNVFVGFFYWVAQMLGGLAGAGIVYACWPRGVTDLTQMGLNALSPGVSTAGGFFAEFFGTALLCFVVFGTAISPKGSKGVTHMAPLAIGFTVFLAHVILIPVTGCGINPARSSASAVFAGVGTDLWLYWIAPLTGGVFGAAVHWFFFIWQKNKHDSSHDSDKSSHRSASIA